MDDNTKTNIILALTFMTNVLVITLTIKAFNLLGLE